MIRNYDLWNLWDPLPLSLLIVSSRVVPLARTFLPCWQELWTLLFFELFSCYWAKPNKLVVIWCSCFVIINLSNANHPFFLGSKARRSVAQFSLSHFFLVNILSLTLHNWFETEAACCLGNRRINDDYHGRVSPAESILRIIKFKFK